MTASIRFRVLLLVLSVLVPAVVAALWVIAQAYRFEQQALDQHLRDATRAMAAAVDLVRPQHPVEWQQLIDGQGLPPDWQIQAITPGGEIVALPPRTPAPTAHRLTTPALQPLAPGTGLAFDTTDSDGRAMRAYRCTTPRGWTLASALPAPTLTAAMPPAVRQALLGSLLLLGLAALTAWWVAQRPAAAAGLTGTASGAAAAGAAGAAEAATIVARAPDAELRISRSQHIEALGRLTGGVAHDFNNLLGVISNSAHLIQRQSPAADLQAPLAATLRAVAIGSRLTQQLLRFAAQRPLCAQPVELAGTLHGLRDLLQTVMGARTEVTVAVAADTPCVTVDTNELELALTNLSLNARDAMPSGGHLHLQARRAHDDEVPDLPEGRYVLITISDDGLGIDDDTVERVFEPFFTTKAIGQGTGLSLAQVMGFCVQAGGTARLTSTEGLGTTVSLLLPAREDPPTRVDAATPGHPPSSIDGARLLLVEDNDDLAEVTAALLSRMGCEVQRAVDPQSALRLIANEPAFDVVLSDVKMPGGMDGLGLARVLREACPGLPVVLISGHAAQTSAGEDFVVLDKPCQPADLVAALHEAIEGPAAQR